MAAIRILVVDDEIALANLIENYLKRMGFEVEALSDSLTALERFRTADPNFHLVIADMTMPKLSGEDLLLAVLQSNGDVRAILCSGYPSAGVSLQQNYAGRFEFLQKPFPPRKLAEVVDRLLGPDRRAQPAPRSAI